MVKKLLCALVVLTAVPALAQDKDEEVRVFVNDEAVHAQSKDKEMRVFVSSGSGNGPLAPLPPLPPEPPLAAPSYGIPPQVAAKIGLPQTLVQKVQDLTFASNDALIGLEAELKRNQLALEKELRQPSPNESSVKDLVEKVGRAETAVRQNRVGLMVAIKKTLGPDYWQKLEAEMGPMTPGSARQIRIERRLAAPPAPPAPPAPGAAGQEREDRKH